MPGGCAFPLLLDVKGHPHQENNKQMSRIEGVKEPLGDFGLHMGGQEDQGRGQDGEDLEANGMSAHHQGQRVLQAAAPQSEM